MTKERFDFLAKTFDSFHKSEEDVIEGLVNRLIEALYLPVGEKGQFYVDPDRTRLYKIDHEPINWGDLKCVEVKRFEDDSFLITIDEASPGECPTFCAYIHKYLKAWGWDTQVQTEW